MEKNLKAVLNASVRYIEANDSYDIIRAHVVECGLSSPGDLEKLADSIRRRASTRSALDAAMCAFIGYCDSKKIRP